MNSKEAWQIFTKTGSVIDYLIYKKIKKQETIKN